MMKKLHKFSKVLLNLSGVLFIGSLGLILLLGLISVIAIALKFGEASDKKEAERIQRQERILEKPKSTITPPDSFIRKEKAKQIDPCKEDPDLGLCHRHPE